MTSIDTPPTQINPVIDTHPELSLTTSLGDRPDADATEPTNATSTEDPTTEAPVLSAEEQLNQAAVELRHLERELNVARKTIDALERREKISDRLRQAGAIDLEVARLLTEVAIADMEEPDVRLAVEDLRRHKPYLFATRSTPLSQRSMGARHDAADPADDAAARAGQSGDRRDLMDYLRLRRRA